MTRALLGFLLISILALNIEAKKGNSKENWTKENSKEMKDKNRDLVCGYEKNCEIQGTQISRLDKKKLADCCDECSSNQDCYFFSYDKKNKVCFLWQQNGQKSNKKKDCKFH